MPGTCKLNITAKTITLYSNGQVPLQLPPSEVKRLSNAIAATVLFPDGQSSALVGAVAPTLVNDNNTNIHFDFDLNMPDGVHPPDPKQPAARLFRYLFLDNTDGQGSPLYIDVTETVKASLLSKIVADALGGALSAGAGLVPGGEIVTGVVKGLVSGLGTWLSNLGGDSLSLVGSGSTRLYADQLLAVGKQEITLDLISGKKDISQNWFLPGQFKPDGSPIEKGETVLIPANSKNGSITLILEAFPVLPALFKGKQIAKSPSLFGLTSANVFKLDAISQDIIARTKRWESSVLYMYLDTTGNVTVGVGNKLPTPDSAAALAFLHRDTGKAATDSEKRTEWQTIKAQTYGQNYPATYYDQFAHLAISQPDADSLLVQRLTSFESDLRGIFTSYDSFLEEAQAALVDMIYTLGKTGLLAFGTLVTAVRDQEWFAAADQSRRGGVPDGRNAEIKELFETAGQKSVTLAGRWVGTYTTQGDGTTAQVTIVFTKTGSQSYSGQLTGVSSAGVYNYALAAVQLDASRNITFSVTGVDGGVFRGSINVTFTQMTGTMFVGSDVDGVLTVSKQ